MNINLGFGFRCTKTHPMFSIASKVKSLKSDVCVQKTLRSSCCYISNYLNTETIGCIRTGYRYLFVRFIFLHTRQNTKHHTAFVSSPRPAERGPCAMYASKNWSFTQPPRESDPGSESQQQNRFQASSCAVNSNSAPPPTQTTKHTSTCVVLAPR